MSRDKAKQETQLSDEGTDPHCEDASLQSETAPVEDRAASRRRFIAKAGKTIAYAAPIVLLFKPKEAIAASGGGSAITPG